MNSVKIDDLLTYHFYGNLKSKDGLKVFVDGCADEKENAYNFVLQACTNDKIIPLTSFGKESNYYIEDNEHVLFCGNRKNIEKSTSLYRISLKGGEAQEIARFDKPGFTVLGYLNENTLVLQIKEKLVEVEADYEVFDEIPFYSNGQGVTNKHRTHVYTYNLDTKELKNIFEEDTFDAGVVRIHDGAIYVLGQNWTRKQSLTENIYKYDGKLTTYVDCKGASIHGFEFIEDKMVVIANTHEKFGINENPKFFDKDMNLICDWQDCVGNSVGTDCAVVAGNATGSYKNALYFVSTIYDHNNLYKLENDEISLVFEWTGTIHSFTWDEDVLYFIGADCASMQQLYKVENGKAVQLSNFNDLKDTYVAAPVDIEFGKDLKGWVLLPKDYDSNKKYPAILDVHGGPKTVYGTVFYHEMQVWASLGYFVFFCNIQGSDGRGNEFADIRGKYGTVDYEQLMLFTDTVLEKYPQIDASKVGVTGGSYGGFMTNWIIGHTDRFAAAASQRSISNWISFSQTSDIGPYFTEDQQASTYDVDPEKLWWHSPLKYAKNVKTPTLFIHSDEDYRCPLSEGLQMLNALLDQNIEARMCLFHGENHDLSRTGLPMHRLRRLNEITNWMEQHLK